MTEELKEIGLDVGHRRVGRLMRQNGISVVRTCKHKVTTRFRSLNSGDADMDLSRFRAAPSARLSRLLFECDEVFQPSAE